MTSRSAWSGTYLCTLGRRAREWVSQERDWKHIVPRYVNIYESALARRSPAAEPARID